MARPEGDCGHPESIVQLFGPSEGKPYHEYFIAKTPMSGRGRILPDVPGLFCLLGFTGLVFLGGGGRALQCADTLWHIKAGTVMLAQGRILTSDVFSHTAAGKAWMSHEWLAEVIMALLHQTAGLPGVVVFYLLLAALTFWLLARIVRERTGDWLALMIVGVGALLASTHLLARPHLFSWLLGVVTLHLLLRGGRGLFLLPVLTAVWANLHGGFILGLFLQGVFIAGGILDRYSLGGKGIRLRELYQEFRIPLLVFALSILAVGINPNGYKVLAFFFHATTPAFSAGIGEWRSPNLQNLWYVRFYLVGMLFLLLLAPCRVPWRDRLLVVLLVNAALTHSRNVSIMALFLAPFLGDVLRAWGDRVPKIFGERPTETKQLELSGSSGPVMTLVLALVCLGVLASGSSKTAWAATELFKLPRQFSAPAVAYLQGNLPSGNLYNEYSLGGYLLYAVDPPPKVFIDGRADMYGEEIFLDYKKISRLEEDPEGLMAQYGIDWVVFTTRSPLVVYLKETGRWRTVFEDDEVTILVAKAGREPVDRTGVHRLSGPGSVDVLAN